MSYSVKNVPKASTSPYLIVSFSFNFLARVVSEILAGSEIYTRGPLGRVPCPHLADVFGAVA